MLFTAPARQFAVVCCFIPCAHQLRQDGTSSWHDDECVRWPEFRQRHALQCAVVIAQPTINRENQRQIGVPRAALRVQVKVSELDDLVAPELEAHWFRHPERVDVENSATHRELRHILHHRHTFESDGLQMRNECFRATHIAFAQLQSRTRQCLGERRQLQDRARRRQQQTHPTAHQLLERFDALTRHFRVRFYFAEAFARWIQCDRCRVDDGFEVGQPAFGVAYLVGDHDDQPLWQRTREGGDKHGVTRPGQSSHTDARPCAG